MSSIGVSDATKDEWDELKPEDMTHDEFCQHALDCVRRDNGEIVNVDELVQQITERTVTNVEIAAFRGTKEALDVRDT